MTTVTVVYHDDYEPEENVLADRVVEGNFDNASDAVRWLVANLAGWCVDEDVSIWVDGVPFWNGDA